MSYFNLSLLDKPNSFVIGATVKPKKFKINDDGEQRENYYLHNCYLTLEKEYKIVKISHCGPMGCSQHEKGCPGKPYIINDNGDRIAICGWGAPNGSFDIIQNWDS